MHSVAAPGDPGCHAVSVSEYVAPRASSSFLYVVRVFRSSYAEPYTWRTDSAHYSRRYREAVKGSFAKSYDELCAQSWDWHVCAVRTLTRMLAVSSLPTSPHPMDLPIGITIHALLYHQVLSTSPLAHIHTTSPTAHTATLQTQLLIQDRASQSCRENCARESVQQQLLYEHVGFRNRV